MVPSTLYSLSFLIGLSAAAPAADYGYGYSSDDCTTTTHTPTTTCTEEAAKYTDPAPYSSKGGYHSSAVHYSDESAKGYPTKGYSSEESAKGYPTKGYSTKGYPTESAKGYPTQGYSSKGYSSKGYPTKGADPHETSKYPSYSSSTGYYGGHNNATSIYVPGPETTEYPSVDPFPTTTSDDYTFTDEPTSTITDEPSSTITDEPTATTTDEPTPEPTGETITAPGPLGGDVTFAVDRDQSIEGSVFDQSEVPQQAIDDGVALDFCAGACAVSSYICDGFELFTNEFDVLICTLKFDLGGLTPSDGSISGVTIAGTDNTGGADDGSDDGSDDGTIIDDGSDDGTVIDDGSDDGTIIDDGTDDGTIIDDGSDVTDATA